MFALRMSGCAVWSINDFAEALAFYEKCKPIEGDDGYRRVKGKEGSKQMSVYMTVARDSVRFRYHHTDVVVWRRDNSYSLNLQYGSVSTAIFANRFIPKDHAVLRQGHVIQAHGHLWPTRHSRVTVLPDDEVTGIEREFVKQQVNRLRAKEALKQTRYGEFSRWHKVMSNMLEDNGKLKRRYRFIGNNQTMLELLETEEGWHDLLLEKDSLVQLRGAIYEKFEVYDTQRVIKLPAKANSNSWIIE